MVRDIIPTTALAHKAVFVPFKATDRKDRGAEKQSHMCSLRLHHQCYPASNLIILSIVLSCLSILFYLTCGPRPLTLSPLYHLCNKQLTPTAKGRVLENQRWKEGKMYFLIKNSLYSIPQGFTSEVHEKWATMWPHSDQLFTIWKASAEHWRSQMLSYLWCQGLVWMRTLLLSHS